MNPSVTPSLSLQSTARRSPLGLILLALYWIGTVLGSAPFASGQGVSNLEQQVKAVFLYQFVKYVKWPPLDESETGTPLVIGVYRESSVLRYLKETIENPAKSNRVLIVRQIETLAQPPFCQVLFIDKAYKRQLPEILTAVNGKPVLTVSDSDGFAEKGGIIQFVNVDGKIKFIINHTAAKSAGLTINARLLALARKVY